MRALLVAVLLSLVGCGQSAKSSWVDFTSSRHLKVRGTLQAYADFKPQASLLPGDEAALRSAATIEIGFQLKFAIGQNRFKDSSFKHQAVQIDRLEARDGGYYRAHYHTTVTMTVAKRASPRLQLPVILPIRSDEATLRRVAEGYPGCYEKSRTELIAEYGEANWHAMAFYYFRPENPGCALSRSGASDGVLLNAVVSLGATSDNDDAKRPNYHAVWSDRTIKISMVFTPSKALVDTDEGVLEYVKMYDWLAQGYAPYVVQNNLAYTRPGTTAPTAHVVLDFRNGLRADVTMLLFGLDWKEDPEHKPYRALVAQATRDADYVSYNGHADYGHNVETLEDWWTVTPGRYQIFYINGCSTFAYLADELFDKHVAANPGARRSEFLDVIVNNNSGYFAFNALQNQVLIRALMAQSASYLDVFRQVDQQIPEAYNPGMIVVGDESY